MATHSSILAWRIPWTERSLEGYSPWDRKEWDATEHALMHTYRYTIVSMILKFHGKASKKKCYKSVLQGNSLTVQWLGLRASTAGGTGSIPGWEGDKITQAAQCSRKIKKKKKNHKERVKKALWGMITLKKSSQTWVSTVERQPQMYYHFCSKVHEQSYHIVNNLLSAHWKRVVLPQMREGFVDFGMVDEGCIPFTQGRTGGSEKIRDLPAWVHMCSRQGLADTRGI